tara:strand:- start:168 stop:413 length:246 start_codon:yes stop_codon:yes gene_type:complete
MEKNNKDKAFYSIKNLKKGMSVYEVNQITGDISLAIHEDNKENGSKGDVIMKADCFYVPALNVRNVLRKLGSPLPPKKVKY